MVRWVNINVYGPDIYLRSASINTSLPITFTTSSWVSNFISLAAVTAKTGCPFTNTE